MGIVWIEEDVVVALHEEHLAEHGGPVGLRDAGLLQSALARPRNLAACEDPDIFALAAAYGYGIMRNHPFLDGNKRTSLVVTELFLALNGYELAADDSTCVTTMISLADGSLAEEGFATWLRSNCTPIHPG
jgi:death on curing protein